MEQKFYLYRFLDKNNNILYIGRTNNIRRRILTEHFTSKTHLRKECYLQTQRVEFAEFPNESEQVAYEAILINQNKPRYNTQFKDDGSFNIALPNIEWKPFEWDFDAQMEIMKAMKKETVNITEVLKQIYNNLDTQTSVRKAYWGFEKMDNIALLAAGTTALIAGCSGTYKTAYAIAITLANAKNGKKVLYVNLKESFEAITQRFLSTESAVELKKLQTSELTKEDWDALVVATSNLSNGAIEFYNRTMLGGKLESILKAIQESNCDLVVIDDINSIIDFENSYDQDKNIAVMNSIRQSAIDNQCPIVMLYSFNTKELKARQDKRPLMTDLPSNSLCSYSDIVQFIYVGEYFEDIPNTDCKDVEIITAKNNIGYTASVVVSANKGRLLAKEE